MDAHVAKVSAVILAAGRGSRLGTPKAILEAGSRPRAKPLALMQAENLKRAGIGSVDIVIGCEHKMVKSKLAAGGNNIVVNKGWRQGQFSSLKAGISVVEKGKWVLLMPVDTVGVKKNTILMILNAAEASVDAVVPSFRGKRGHPVLLSQRLCARIARMDPKKSRLDHVLHGSKTTVIEVSDRAVLSNINTLDALAGQPRIQAARTWKRSRTLPRHMPSVRCRDGWVHRAPVGVKLRFKKCNKIDGRKQED
jgi:CTP:molybdopterin cytidylyltransferase MocA